MTAEEYKRMITEEAREKGMREGIQEGMQKGIQEGMQKGIQQGMQKGRQLKLISLVMRKIEKGCTPAQTADMLEEDPALIRRIYDAIGQTAPEHDMETICGLLAENMEE